MSKLFIFGDSFSSNLDKLRHNKNVDRYANEYGVNGQYDIWFEIIRRKMDIEVVCLGNPGASNNEIFQTVCKNINLIQENDIVIINWSVVDRFRVAKNDHTFITILPSYITTEQGSDLMDSIKYELKHSDISIDSIIDIGHNRIKNEKIFQREVNDWSRLLFKYFDSNNIKVLFWGICSTQKYFFTEWFMSESEQKITIREESDEKINDLHYGINGNKLFAEKVIETITNDKKASLDDFAYNNFF
jgi:hypothetical protein